jgi:serine/threonine-protein kinase
MEEGELFQNKYRIGKVLGEGGMGVVYAAVQEPSGLRVAIKFVSARNVKARNLQGERLIREARVLARLNHGNLVRLYDFDKTAEGDYFIVMELVEGDTLRTLVSRARKQGKGLDPQQVLHIMAQVAEGMALAHKAGVVHRDLKPENIMVLEGADPIVRVVDFGLAKNPVGGVPPLAGGAETNPANVVGTPLYMAPEQVRGHEIDARTDIYAIGVTMYEALTGHAPYARAGEELQMTEIMARHCFAEPTPIREHVPNCPERIAKIVLRCLAKDPADRYQTARELARDIRMVLAEEAKAQHREHKTGERELREVRETAPMPSAWSPGVVLPFVSSEHAPASASRAMRETAPMPPPGPDGLPQPTYAATQSAIAATGRGVGYTTKMQKPSAAALAAAEEEVARERAASPVPVAESASPSDAPRSGPVPRESCVERSSDPPLRPSPASTSGTHLKQPESAVAPAALTGTDTVLDRRNELLAMSPRQSLSGASVTQPGRSSRGRIFGVPPMFAAPIVGSAIAALVLSVVVLRRTPARQEVPRPTATTTAPVSPPAPAEPATTQQAPAGTASPATPPSSTPIAAAPADTSQPASGGSASVATARTAPTAAPRGPTASPKPAERTASPKPPQPSLRVEREPAANPTPAPTPPTGRLFGVDR